MYISLHINNCFKEGELNKVATVKESLTVQLEGNRKVKRKIELYNLDVIISVGYRVKSSQGKLFNVFLYLFLNKEYTLSNSLFSKFLFSVITSAFAIKPFFS